MAISMETTTELLRDMDARIAGILPKSTLTHLERISDTLLSSGVNYKDGTYINRVAKELGIDEPYIINSELSGGSMSGVYTISNKLDEIISKLKEYNEANGE